MTLIALSQGWRMQWRSVADPSVAADQALIQEFPCVQHLAAPIISCPVGFLWRFYYIGVIH